MWAISPYLSTAELKRLRVLSKESNLLLTSTDSLARLYAQGRPLMLRGPGTPRTLAHLTPVGARIRNSTEDETAPFPPGVVKVYAKNLTEGAGVGDALAACPRLTEIRLEASHALQELPLPMGIRKLELVDLGGLLTLPALAFRPALRDVYLRDLPALHTLGPFPEGLEELHLRDLPALEGLPPLPSSLRRLSLHTLPSVRALPLSEGIEELKLIFLPHLKTLPPLDDHGHMTKLELLHLPELQALPSLPPHLQTLRLKLPIVSLPPMEEYLDLVDLDLELELLTNLPNLPPNTEKLRLHWLRALSTSTFPPLGEYPRLTDVDLKFIPTAQMELPPNVNKLRLWCMNQLATLPPIHECASLTEVELGNLPPLTELEKLPPHIKTLSLHWLQNLTSLPPLEQYASLSSVDLRNLPAITTVLLPPDVKKVMLYGIPNLKDMPALDHLKDVFIDGSIRAKFEASPIAV